MRLITGLAKSAFIRLDSFKNRRILAVEQQHQELLRHMHQQEFMRTGKSRSLRDIGWKSYSNFGEDGVLHYVFALVGTTNKRAIELGCSNGLEGNVANLIINQGFMPLMIDGDARALSEGIAFFGNHERCRLVPPKFVHAWITRDNVNSLFSDNGFAGEIDLLSMDLDGNDYWIWQAIEVVRPRVVIMECQDIWPADQAKTVPYSESFAHSAEHGFDYCGASLAALAKLARAKGYRLIGAEETCINAVFMRNDVGANVFPEVEPDQCLVHPWNEHGRSERLPKVRHLDWVDV